MEMRGVIRSIKEKETKTGNLCLAYLCETSRGNKFWFLAWGKDYNTARRGSEPCSPLFVGQEIVVDAGTPTTDQVNTDKKTGAKMVFLPPNPPLLEVQAPTDTMRREKRYLEMMRAHYGPGRTGKALIHIWENNRERVDAVDVEFVESLYDNATGSRLSPKQTMYAQLLVARYTARIATYHAQLDRECNRPEINHDDPPLRSDDLLADHPARSAAPPADIDDKDF